MKALSITNLKKEYTGGLQALKGIDLNVEKGDFFALLGPNGAGKSTTIGIISSLVTKTSGEVKILDIDIDENHSLAKKKLFTPNPSGSSHNLREQKQKTNYKITKKRAFFNFFQTKRFH